jgi:hypothetical protein
VSTTSFVLLLVTLFFGIGLVWFLARKDFQPPYPPWNLATRRQNLVVACVLVLGAFGAFLLSLVDPALFPN